MGRKTPKIAIFTASGQYNLGDELILLAEYELLKQQYPGAVFSVFTYQKNTTLLPTDSNIRFVSYFPNNLKNQPLKNVWYFLQNVFTIATSDCVIIGGGGLLYDDENGQSFAKPVRQWLFRVKIANIF